MTDRLTYFRIIYGKDTILPFLLSNMRDRGANLTMHDDCTRTIEISVSEENRVRLEQYIGKQNAVGQGSIDRCEKIDPTAPMQVPVATPMAAPQRPALTASASADVDLVRSAKGNKRARDEARADRAARMHQRHLRF